MSIYTIRATRDAFEIGYAHITADTPEAAIEIFNTGNPDIEWVEFGACDVNPDPAVMGDIEAIEEDGEDEPQPIEELIDNLQRYLDGGLSRAALEATVYDLRRRTQGA